MAVDQRTAFPLADDHFSGQQNITGSIAGLEDLFNQVNEETVSSTYEETQWYVDGTNGDDANGGTSWSDAKQSIAAMYAEMPSVIAHNSTLYLRNTLPDTGALQIYLMLLKNAKFVIEGMSDSVDEEVVAGPFTADAGLDVTAVKTTALGATPDEYSGYWLRVDNDPTVLRNIVEHTADTFYFGRNLNTDPSSSTYSIIRPKTQIQANMALTIVGAGLCYPQRMRLIDSARLNMNNCSVRMRTCGIIEDTTGSTKIRAGNCPAPIDFFSIPVDPDTYATNADQVLGVSQRTTNSSIELVNSSVGFISSAYARTITISNGNLTNFLLYYGSRCHGSMTLSNVNDALADGLFLGDTSTASRSPQIDGAAGAGLVLTNSHLASRASASTLPLIIKDCGSHGIEMIGSSFVDNAGGVLTGTGNTTSGVYAHFGSKMLIKDGDPPTISGDSGNVELTMDGSTQKSTWATIDAGTPAVDATTHFSTVYEQ